MLSTIIGFALSLSPIAMEAPEGNISQEVNKSVLHISLTEGRIRIDANKETMRMLGNNGKLHD